MTTATQAAPAMSRFEARITADLHATLKWAAQLQGRSMTDFAVTALQKSAQEAIEQHEVLRLNRADSEAFAAALINPPQPNAALLRAQAAHQRLVTSDV
jgi:uncharacterized protein (DUF1778 family)